MFENIVKEKKSDMTYSYKIDIKRKIIIDKKNNIIKFSGGKFYRLKKYLIEQVTNNEVEVYNKIMEIYNVHGDDGPFYKGKDGRLYFDKKWKEEFIDGGELVIN
jgi:isocitrate dehydrogenase